MCLFFKDVSKTKPTSADVLVFGWIHVTHTDDNLMLFEWSLVQSLSSCGTFLGLNRFSLNESTCDLSALYFLMYLKQ